MAPDHVGRISLTWSLRAIGPSMPSTKSASPSHQNMAGQRSSLAATSDRKARKDPDAVRRWTEKARAWGQVTFLRFTAGAASECAPCRGADDPVAIPGGCENRLAARKN